MRAIASVDTVFWVDATLRYASAVLAEAGGGGVEGILCVRPGQLGMEVVVDPRAEPVGRFESADEGRTWTLDPDIDLPELQELAWGQALAPALCSVGATADGPVLVDLEQAGVLSVEGDPGWVEGFLAGAALEVASAPWSADTALYLLHGDERLAVRELVEAVEDEHAFLGGLERLSSLVDDEELAGIPTTLAARVAPGNAEGWFPTVVVACPGTDPAVVAELAERARPRRSGLALVGPGPLPGARWRLLIGADGHGVLEPLGLELDARVDVEVVGTLAGRLAARAQPADVAPVVELVPELVDLAEEFDDVGDDAAEGDDEPMEGEVRVLGPVEVTWGDGDRSPPDRASVLAAVVSYLGTHDDHPVPAERLQEAIWPLLDDDPSGDVRAGCGQGHNPALHGVAGPQGVGQGLPRSPSPACRPGRRLPARSPLQVRLDRVPAIGGGRPGGPGQRGDRAVSPGPGQGAGSPLRGRSCAVVQLGRRLAAGVGHRGGGGPRRRGAGRAGLGGGRDRSGSLGCPSGPTGDSGPRASHSGAHAGSVQRRRCRRHRAGPHRGGPGGSPVR